MTSILKCFFYTHSHQSLGTRVSPAEEITGDHYIPLTPSRSLKPSEPLEHKSAVRRPRSETLNAIPGSSLLRVWAGDLENEPEESRHTRSYRSIKNSSGHVKRTQKPTGRGPHGPKMAGIRVTHEGRNGRGWKSIGVVKTVISEGFTVSPSLSGPGLLHTHQSDLQVPSGAWQGPAHLM